MAPCNHGGVRSTAPSKKSSPVVCWSGAPEGGVRSYGTAPGTCCCVASAAYFPRALFVRSMSSKHIYLLSRSLLCVFCVYRQYILRSRPPRRWGISLGLQPRSGGQTTQLESFLSPKRDRSPVKISFDDYRKTSTAAVTAVAA